MTVRYDLSSKELHNNAHEIFRKLRTEDPVHRGIFMRRDVYFVTRYDDVKEVLRSPERFVKDPANSSLGSAGRRALPIPKMAEPLMNSMITSDDPAHRRLRRLISKAFTPRTVASLKPAIETKARSLAADLERLERTDFIPTFALPLPVHIITVMMGVPAEDIPRFQRIIHNIVRNATPWNMPRIMMGLWSYRRYIDRLCATKRESPGEDLLSALVLAEDEGERLSSAEAVAMSFLLLSAGHETTVSLIANGVLTLASEPGAWRHLQQDPELLPSAIEEVLRFESPTLGTEFYYARDDIEMRGTRIPAGAAIMPMVISANRDERAFDAPDTLRLDRSPNRHMAFGTGLHACVGASLSRLEAKVAFTELLTRFDAPQLLEERASLRFQNALFLHRLKRLPLRFRPLRK